MIRRILIPGLVGEIAFEIYAWLISPVIFGPVLQPAKLVAAIIAKLSGLMISPEAAFALHFLVGAVGFSIAVLLLQKLTRFSPVAAGALTGVLLWFVAQGILAPFIGRSFMMDFGVYTQSSFVGHVGMTMIIGWLQGRYFADRR